MSTELITWTHPTHGSITLHGGTNYSILKNRIGLDNVPFTVTRARTPGGHGSRITNVYVGERQLSLGLLMHGFASASEFITARSMLNKFFNPVDADGGYFTWTNLAGESRRLYATYLTGLEGNDEEADLTWAKFSLSFVCPDPFWYSSAESSNLLSGASGTAFFTVPFLPLNINESSLTDGANITNLGDFEAWPRITIEGPCSGIEITNTTTGKTIDLTEGSGLALTAGQIATIETKPGARSIYRDDSTNLFQYFTADSEFWSFAPGTNNVTIVASGTSAATEFGFYWRHTYTLK